MIPRTVITEKGLATHFIDLAAIPQVPIGYRLVKHTTGNQAWEYDKSTILGLALKQFHAGIEPSDALIEEQNVPELNINMFNYLMANQELMPVECKGIPLTFFGTRLGDAQGPDHYFARIYYDGKQYRYDYICLDA